jgi:hypothetical protein
MVRSHKVVSALASAALSVVTECSTARGVHGINLLQSIPDNTVAARLAVSRYFYVVVAVNRLWTVGDKKMFEFCQRSFSGRAFQTAC